MAALAGISVEYYARIERGRKQQISESVLDALARALELNDLEATHLRDLAHAVANRSSAPKNPVHHSDAVRPPLQVIIDALSPQPAWISNHRMDFLAGNREANAIYSPLFSDPADEGNRARFLFLNPNSRIFEIEWDRVAAETVGALRRYVTRHPEDRKLAKLIVDLNSQSAEFSTLWADHNVVHHRRGKVLLNHPAIGNLELDYERFDSTFDPDLTIFILLIENDSSAAHRVAELVQDSTDR